jgi:hypothetical protein
MSAWTCRHTDGKVVQKIVPPRPRIPWWKGPGADSEEKQEPASDIDTALVDSLKVLDPKGPIREADMGGRATVWPCSLRRSGDVLDFRSVRIALAVQACFRPRRPSSKIAVA